MRKGILAILFASGVFLSCGENKEGETVVGAKAKVSLVGGTSLVGLTPRLVDDPSYDHPSYYTPNAFKIKIMNVYIKQEADTTKYPASQLWVNAACNPSELTTYKEDYSSDTAEEDRIKYKYIGIEKDCYADDLTEFFDLARPPAEVNAAINSQHLPVLPGKYKYINISFCRPNYDKKPTVTFKTDGMSEEGSLIAPGTCGVESAEIVPPLEIKEDAEVTVKLNYTLNDLFLDYGADFNYSPLTDTSSGQTDCVVNSDKSVRRCINRKLFSITASIEG